MKITSIGDGLTILISCDYFTHHSWMSYLCWYSLNKNLPDAKVIIGCNRTDCKYDLFRWTYKCKVPFILHKTTDFDGQIDAIKPNKPCLVIPPEVMCVRDFDEANFSPNVFFDEEKIYKLDDDLVCNCREDKSFVFASYNEGWGNFVTKTWIHNEGNPFLFGDRFNKGSLTPNEARIGKLWIASIPLFQIVSGG